MHLLLAVIVIDKFVAWINKIRYWESNWEISITKIEADSTGVGVNITAKIVRADNTNIEK